MVVRVHESKLPEIQRIQSQSSLASSFSPNNKNKSFVLAKKLKNGYPMGTNLPKALPFAQMKDIYLPQDAVIAHKKPFDQVQSRVYDSSNGSGQDLRLGATKRKNRATIL